VTRLFAVRFAGMGLALPNGMIKITRLSSSEDPVVRLRVEGRVVLHTAGELVRAAIAALGDAKPVLLDFGGVAFVDVEGAGAIAALTRRNVTVTRCSPFVGALLRSHAEQASDEPRDDDARNLVARLRNQEAAAFEEMVRRYGSRMLAVARCLLRSEDDARDVVQEAFLAAGKNLGALQSDARLWAWLRHLVADAALMRLRSRRRTPEASVDGLLPRFDEDGHWASVVAPLALPPDIVECRETRAAVRRCMDQLPDSSRFMLVLRDLEGFDADEVATLLDTPASAVKTRLHGARQALRTLLAAELVGATRPVQQTMTVSE
jgi:RNA polymerase sigma-70 factor (ECF subfamily)